MIRLTIPVLLILPFLTPAVHAQPTAIHELEWKLSSSAESCMVHAYDDQLFIFLSVRADSQFVFRVHSQDWAWSDDKPVRVTISGGEKRFAIDASTALTSNKMSGFVFAAPESTVDLFPDSGPVDIELSGGEEAELTLPPLDSALRQLKECANQLPRVARDEYAVRAPRPVTLGPLGPSDFEGLGRLQGTLRYRLYVDEFGSPTRCEIRETSGTPAIDARACELLLERSKFEPGLNAKGEPVAATFRSGIEF